MRNTFNQLRKSCEGDVNRMKAFNKLVKSFKSPDEIRYTIVEIKGDKWIPQEGFKTRKEADEEINGWREDYPERRFRVTSKR